MSNQYRDRDIRRIRPGFPIKDKFKCITDVNEYLQQEKIICLLCGRSFKLLATHLTRIHNVSDSQYKSMYDIPWTYPIVTRSVGARRSELNRELGKVQKLVEARGKNWRSAPKRRPPHFILKARGDELNRKD